MFLEGKPTDDDENSEADELDSPPPIGITTPPLPPLITVSASSRAL